MKEPPVEIAEAQKPKTSGRRGLQGWPTLLGAAFAAYVAMDLVKGEENGHQLASIVAASALVYLGAAALAKPSTAWPVFFLSVVVITAAKVGLTDFDATWLLLGLAGLFLAYGLLRRARGSSSGLPLQALAMLVFGAVASVALFVNREMGAYLVAAGLFAHAGWDAYHHLADRVVSRSLAEFCFALDVALALTIVVVTVKT